MTLKNRILTLYKDNITNKTSNTNSETRKSNIYNYNNVYIILKKT